MAKQFDETEKTVNLLLTSVLILLICIIVAAMGYFSFTLGILTPPGASSAPGRVGGSGGSGTGIATPGGDGELAQSEDAGEIVFPGFVNFKLSDGRDTVELKNDGTNRVYFRFVVSDENGTPLYASDNVQPGGAEQWRVTDAFDPGTGKHTVSVTIDSYGLEDEQQYNGIRSTFTVDMG